jgi:hypothetical protein
MFQLPKGHHQASYIHSNVAYWHVHIMGSHIAYKLLKYSLKSFENGQKIVSCAVII